MIRINLLPTDKRKRARRVAPSPLPGGDLSMGTWGIIYGSAIAIWLVVLGILYFAQSGEMEEIAQENKTLEVRRDELKVKTLIDFAREDGLISVDPELRPTEMATRIEPHFESGIISRDIRDIMDWPPSSFTDGGMGERDNHEMLPISTVTNAFHCHALELMARMAGLLGRAEDQAFFSERAARVARRINELFFDPDRCIFIDG